MDDWRSQRDDALQKLKSSTNLLVRAESAELLCELAAEDAGRAEELGAEVAPLLADGQTEVRCAGLALAAAVLPTADAEEVLVRFAVDEQPRVRIEAIGRLADLGSQTTRGVLARALEDELFDVRFEAARGMAALKHRAGLEVLLKGLDSPDFRYRAMGALAELGATEAVEPLRKLLRRWFLPVFDRTRAAAALAKLGDAEGVAHLMKRAEGRWSADRAMALELLGDVKAPRAFEVLAKVVRQREDAGRGAAARGLGRLGDARALEPLLELFRRTDEPEDIHLDAAEGLCLLRLPEGVAEVERALGRFSSEGQAEVRQLLEESRS